MSPVMCRNLTQATWGLAANSSSSPKVTAYMCQTNMIDSCEKCTLQAIKLQLTAQTDTTLGVKACKVAIAAMQASPSVQLQNKDYLSLAEQTLTTSGMASTAWVLIQLHIICAIHFYSLPTHSTDASNTHSSPSNKQATESDTATTASQADQQALGNVNLQGLHTKMAIAMVLSWAAQLSHCNVKTPEKTTNTDIKFLTGESGMQLAAACAALHL